MRMIAVHTMPVYDLTAEEVWEALIAILNGETFEDPEVVGWTNVAIIDIEGERRLFLLVSEDEV